MVSESAIRRIPLICGVELISSWLTFRTIPRVDDHIVRGKD